MPDCDESVSTEAADLPPEIADAWAAVFIDIAERLDAECSQTPDGEPVEQLNAAA